MAIQISTNICFLSTKQQFAGIKNLKPTCKSLISNYLHCFWQQISGLFSLLSLHKIRAKVLFQQIFSTKVINTFVNKFRRLDIKGNK